LDLARTYIKGLNARRDDQPPANNSSADADQQARERAAEIERERRRRDANPVPLGPVSLGPQSRNFTNPNDYSSQISATKNQAFPSAASMRYKESVNPDLEKQIAFTREDAERVMAKNAALPEKTTNEEMVASNIMLATKMDELIDLMRTSNGYQYKISQQVYA